MEKEVVIEFLQDGPKSTGDFRKDLRFFDKMYKKPVFPRSIMKQLVAEGIAEKYRFKGRYYWQLCDGAIIDTEKGKKVWYDTPISTQEMDEILRKVHNAN